VTPQLVLASASTGRLGLLRSIGIEPHVRVSGVDEDEVTGAPVEVVAELARRKAHTVAAAVAGTFDDAVVLGCDSLLDLDGTAHGKPGSPEEAARRWHAMRGRTGVLRTGHCLVRVDGGSVGAGVEETVGTVVRFGQPSDAEVDAYVATGEPLHCAGSFTLDGRSAPFIDGIDGDPSNVIGASLPALRRLLARLDLQLTDWWR
jgi:septum formation protein